jgi:DNA-binding response OmpR family regulator
MTTILVADDERKITDMLRRTLAYEGYHVITAANGREALAQASSQRPDIIVLDWMMPDLDGIEVARRIRENDTTPILMLTARDTIDDRVEGLDSGADDYLVKPFSLEELLARVRAVIRRRVGRASPEIRYGALVVDPARRAVTFRGRAAELSAREFAVLEALLQEPGAVVSRQKLEEAVYGWGEEVESNSVEVHLHNLRRKLAPELIRNLRGVGYRVAKID